MSSSTLQAIWPGEKHENIRELRNSWGTAPIVWGSFCERYLNRSSSWWMGNGSTPQGTEFWALWKRMDIPEAHRAVFMFTLDHIYVAKKDYRRFAQHLREFLSATTVSANNVNHWPQIAQFFEMEPEYPAVSLWCTSVTSDPFNGPYNEGTQDYDPFDWNKAYDLYAEIDSVKDVEATK